MSKRRTDTLKGALYGGAGGAAATVLTQPLDTVIVRIQAEGTPGTIRTIIGPRSFLKALKGEIGSLKNWGGVVPLRVLKGALGSAAILGTYTALRNKQIKTASIYNDLNISKPKFKSELAKPATKPSPKPKKERWSPLNPDARFIWSSLTRPQKKDVNTLVKHMTPRVRMHNKDYIVGQLGKGKRLDVLAKKITNNPNVVF